MITVERFIVFGLQCPYRELDQSIFLRVLWGQMSQSVSESVRRPRVNV